ncbi:MAG: hypothetical protein AAF564_01300 [Bacteroidota bacterium]
MEKLIREYIPHDPTVGLYVAPDIPFKKLHNALEDYAKKVRRKEVVALYDATLMGSAKDGALFMADRFVFQNNNLEPAYEILYDDLVEVNLKKKMMGGQRLQLSVNRGRATINLELDFSGKAKAAPFVARLLEDVMFRTTEAEMARDTRRRSDDRTREAQETDVRVVEETLIALVREGHLLEDDFRDMLRVLNQR